MEEDIELKSVNDEKEEDLLHNHLAHRAFCRMKKMKERPFTDKTT